MLRVCLDEIGDVRYVNVWVYSYLKYIFTEITVLERCVEHSIAIITLPPLRKNSVTNLFSMIYTYQYIKRLRREINFVFFESLELYSKQLQST